MSATTAPAAKGNGFSIGRLLLGSQTSEVLSHAPVPVLVVR